MDPAVARSKLKYRGSAMPDTGQHGFVLSPNEQVGRDPQHAIAAGPCGTTAVA